MSSNATICWGGAEILNGPITVSQSKASVIERVYEPASKSERSSKDEVNPFVAVQLKSKGGEPPALVTSILPAICPGHKLSSTITLVVMAGEKIIVTSSETSSGHSEAMQVYVVVLVGFTVISVPIPTKFPS